MFYMMARDTIGDIDLMFLPSTNFMVMKEHPSDVSMDSGSVENEQDLSSLMYEDGTGDNHYAKEPFVYQSRKQIDEENNDEL
jgi:hypothetical protein